MTDRTRNYLCIPPTLKRHMSTPESYHQRFIVKVLEETEDHWPEIIEGVLFARRVSVHTSKKYSPLYLLYNRQPFLPISIRYSLTNKG